MPGAACARRTITAKVNGENAAQVGSWYYETSMQRNDKNRQQRISLLRAVIETAFIVFLFYSNLLMGEFTVANSRGKTLAFAINDIFTVTNFVIAMISAVIGYVVFEYLRKKF